MTKYKYCVKKRFSSDFYTQPDWVTVSWHEKRDGAEESLTWEKKHSGKNTEIAIFPA